LEWRRNFNAHDFRKNTLKTDPDRLISFFSARAALSLIFVWLSFVQSTVVVPQIFVQAVLSCFFEAELKLFAGCVNKSQRKSINVKKSQ
jgi:hypothetical protein